MRVASQPAIGGRRRRRHRKRGQKKSSFAKKSTISPSLAHSHTRSSPGQAGRRALLAQPFSGDLSCTRSRGPTFSARARAIRSRTLSSARAVSRRRRYKKYNVNITNDTQPPAVVVLRVGKNMKLFFTPCRYTPHSLPTTTTSLREQSSRRRRAGRQARQHTHTLIPLGTTNEAQTGKSATLPPLHEKYRSFRLVGLARGVPSESEHKHVDGAAALPDWLDCSNDRLTNFV